MLDEPSTYLDIAHSLELMRLLKHLAESGKTIIAVMHDLTLALDFSDKLLLINGGKKVVYGTHSEVLESGAIKKAFGVDVSYIPDKNGYCYKY